MILGSKVQMAMSGSGRGPSVCGKQQQRARPSSSKRNCSHSCNTRKVASSHAFPRGCCAETSPSPVTEVFPSTLLSSSVPVTISEPCTLRFRNSRWLFSQLWGPGSLTWRCWQGWCWFWLQVLAVLLGPHMKRVGTGSQCLLLEEH